MTGVQAQNHVPHKSLCCDINYSISKTVSLSHRQDLQTGTINAFQWNHNNSSFNMGCEVIVFQNQLTLLWSPIPNFGWLLTNFVLGGATYWQSRYVFTPSQFFFVVSDLVYLWSYESWNTVVHWQFVELWKVECIQ